MEGRRSDRPGGRICRAVGLAGRSDLPGGRIGQAVGSARRSDRPSGRIGWAVGSAGRSDRVGCRIGWAVGSIDRFEAEANLCLREQSHCRAPMVSVLLFLKLSRVTMRVMQLRHRSHNVVAYPPELSLKPQRCSLTVPHQHRVATCMFEASMISLYVSCDKSADEHHEVYGGYDDLGNCF
jgi:hypothetical protein